MGIVRKQAVYTSIFEYFGIAVGYINVVLLFPFICTPEEFGLTRIIGAIAFLYGQFSSFGMHKTTVKFFPYFRRKDKSTQGLLLVTLVVPFIGFLVLTGLYMLFKDPILSQYKEQSSLFIDHYYLAIPFSLLVLYGTILNGVFVSMKRTVFPFIMQNVVIRLAWMVDLILYYFKLIDFETFLLFYVYSNGISVVLMFFELIRKGELNLSFSKRMFRPRMRNAMISYSFFSILTGASHLIVARLDQLMIGFLVGLEGIAVYAIASYICQLIHIPSLGIIRISFPLLAAAWKKKNMKEISTLYSKSTVNQLAISGILFVLLWVNLDSVFKVLPDAYGTGRWVFLFLGLVKVIDAGSGINGAIMQVTKYYRVDTFLVFILAIVTIVTNILFIPVWGIEGAAMATLLSMTVYNLIKFLYLNHRLKLQPLSANNLYILVVLVLSLVIGTYFPAFDHFIVDSIIRTLVVSGFFGCSIYFFNLSPDINGFVNEIVRKYIRK